MRDLNEECNHWTTISQMISKRRRHRLTACSEPTPSDLKQMYVKAQNDTLGNDEIQIKPPHLLLKWLIRCETVHKAPQPCRLPVELTHCTNIADAFECLNAAYPAMTYNNLLRFETQMATWIHQNKCSKAVLVYFSSAMYRWRGICRITNMKQVATQRMDLFKWLTPEYVIRGLVVPDIRKLATTIWYTAELRPGESEWVKNIDPMATYSGATLIQKVRTIEYCNAKRHVLQYGTMNDIYQAGMMNYVYLAIIDIRLRNRIQLDWKSKCVFFPSTVTPCTLNTAWPFLYVTPTCVHVVCNSHRCQFEDASIAFMAWHQMCIEINAGIIDGRWHVQHYTI